MNIAVIPCRAGSQELPGKNYRDLCGKPLYMWSVEQAAASGCFDHIIVATNDPVIIKMGAEPHGCIMQRREIFAGPWVATEAVLLEVIGSTPNLNPATDKMCLLQATSPLREPGDIRGAMKTEGESVVSVVKNPHIAPNENRRLMRQERFDAFVENGAIYWFQIASFLQGLNRICGDWTMYQMAQWTRHEIDDADDFLIVENLMWTHLLKEQASRVPA